MLAVVKSITTRYTNPGPAVFRPRGLCCNRRQTDIPAPASPGHPLPPDIPAPASPRHPLPPGQPCIHRLSFTTPELPFIPDSPAALHLPGSPAYKSPHRTDLGLKTSAIKYPHPIATVIPPAAALIPPVTASRRFSFAPSIAPFAREYPNPGNGTRAPVCARFTRGSYR